MHAVLILDGCRHWRNSNRLCVLLKLCGEKTGIQRMQRTSSNKKCIRRREKKNSNELCVLLKLCGEKTGIQRMQRTPSCKKCIQKREKLQRTLCPPETLW
jgi:hypothetical protein